jgi:hypothetical protein
MPANRICHDAAWACALSILELFQNCLRDEEKQDAFDEVFQRVSAAIEAYDIQRAREQARIRASEN